MYIYFVVVGIEDTVEIVRERQNSREEKKTTLQYVCEMCVVRYVDQQSACAAKNIFNKHKLSHHHHFGRLGSSYSCIRCGKEREREIDCRFTE